MATGENFKRINRNSTIKELKEKLQSAKVEFTDYATQKSVNDENFNYDIMHKLENKVESIEYDLYCAEYADNRRRNWK